MIQNEHRRRKNPDDQKLDKVLRLRAAGLVADHWPAVRARGAVDFRPGSGEGKTILERRAALPDLGCGLRCNWRGGLERGGRASHRRFNQPLYFFLRAFGERSLRLWQLLVRHFAQNVEQNRLRFLDSRRVVAGDEQINRRRAIREAAVASEKADAFDALALRLFQSAQNVFRFAAGGECYEHVAFLAKTPDLPRENFVGAVIIAHGGHELAVGRE